MMEQSRHARKFFDLAWFGIGAAGAVDPMAALIAASRIAVQAFSGVLRSLDSTQTRRFDYVRTICLLQRVIVIITSACKEPP